tara:strand:+ start:356 stop:478 length:123 start_codon:yes stop_codon:yes gene_type:complete
MQAAGRRLPILRLKYPKHTASLEVEEVVVLVSSGGGAGAR